jgi:hypothetical protein
MARLGKNQLNFLAGVAGRGRAVVVGDKIIRSLAERGMMEPLARPEGNGSFFVVTSAGLRAVADAMDSGVLPPITIEDFKRMVK